MNQNTTNRRCVDCFQDEMHALYDISKLLLSDLNQQEMFKQLLAIIEAQLMMIRGTIMILLPDNTDLIIQAASMEGDEGVEDVRYQRGEGIIGTVVESGEVVVVPDISKEPQFKNRIHKRKTPDERQVSFICSPVIIENEVVGTFSVDLSHPLPYSLEHGKRTVSIIASMIGGYLRTQRQVYFERQIWQAENQRLHSELEKEKKPSNIIGSSTAMKEVFNRINILSQSDTTVLIRGPSGTGKELIASAVHYSSKRSNGPFVKVNCAALNENLIESELFGHEQGAFSGAMHARKGRIEEASGGTLFLDEFGDISLNTQVKLLRVIQERQFERVGSNETRNADIRLIVATNRDLEKAVEHKTFREDLYYRVNVFPIFLPALSDRKDDIIPLANYFVERFSRQMEKKIQRISTPAINMLMSYHWPGNVRELENCIEYAVLLSTDGVIYGHNLPPSLQVPNESNITATGGLRLRVMSLEHDMIVDALKRNEGNVSAAARELEITPRMVRYKIKQLGINPSQIAHPR